MGFYWKEDQLVARKGLIDPAASPTPSTSPSAESSTSTSNPWSTFDMPLRDPSPMPKSFDVIQFLCPSLTFMNRLRSVQVFIDSFRLARVSKSATTPRQLSLPSGQKSKTSNGLMTVTGIESTGKSFGFATLERKEVMLIGY